MWFNAVVGCAASASGYVTLHSTPFSWNARNSACSSDLAAWKDVSPAMVSVRLMLMSENDGRREPLSARSVRKRSSQAVAQPDTNCKGVEWTSSRKHCRWGSEMFGVDCENARAKAGRKLKAWVSIGRCLCKLAGKHNTRMERVRKEVQHWTKSRIRVVCMLSASVQQLDRAQGMQRCAD